MIALENISLSVSEALAFAGLVQGISILVHLLLRVQVWRQVLPGLACFLVLTVCCFLQFFLRFEDLWPSLRVALLFFWAMVPILSYLLILQIGTARNAQKRALATRPAALDALVVSLPFLAFVLGHFVPMDERACRGWFPSCPDYMQTTYWLASLLGAVVLGLLWFQRGLFEGLRRGTGGRERYWLVLTFIVTNIGIVTVMLLAVSNQLTPFEVEALLLVMGLAGLYLASSSLFRVYPAVIDLAAAPRLLSSLPLRLTPFEESLLAKARDLVDVQKAYHEQSFNRTSFARELGCSESQLSRIIKQAYGKGLPRLLNERRVMDAQRLLKSSKITVNIIAYEVGFNSLASFNRAFKEITGKSPSEYRQSLKEEHS